MKKNKFLNRLSSNFHTYKVSYTMVLLVLSAELGIVGNKFGTLYLILSFLPILVWGLLLSNDRNNTDL
ncbi:hypothetical protein [Clostridium lacusfryxellense]|uniref:hypothetical protein n=1 Tax=Clostridium lacusfryxellense TaxID=205328 RepID=UPI001C0B1D06|nr:hypothetical protein [Clostridium lacusfryxellense]MBU3111200.1 hypothetical protein [Clostridium lacusfryxellense]